MDWQSKAGVSSYLLNVMDPMAREPANNDPDAAFITVSAFHGKGASTQNFFLNSLTNFWQLSM